MENRTYQDLIEDCLISATPPEAIGQKRNWALFDVLKRLPEADYRSLHDLWLDFQIYIPEVCSRAEIRPFYRNWEEDGVRFAKVLYLDPRLERTSFEVVVAIVAHELAHIVLSHKVFNHSEQYNAQEKQAWEKVQEWGFEREFKKYLIYKKRQGVDMKEYLLRR